MIIPGMGYVSPIEVIADRVRTEYEDGILRAVQKYDVKVDREELVKALAYDRHQYEQGYADGLNQRKTGFWIKVPNPNHSPFDNSSEYIYHCSTCGKAEHEESFYCRQCGSYMRGEE